MVNSVSNSDLSYPEDFLTISQLGSQDELGTCIHNVTTTIYTRC